MLSSRGLEATRPFAFGGKTSLVTGASSGIGAEFARQLAARGGHLVQVARSADRLRTLAEELRGAHAAKVTVLPADLSRPEDVSRVVAFTSTTPIDVLVNNAGVGTYGSFAGIDEGGMTVIPGLGNWLMGQVHRFVPRATMVRLASRALAPS
jgi:short-subunit dehydrogenase